MGKFPLGRFQVNYNNEENMQFVFLETSADCGEIDDVIQAYHRLIDLKTKYVDKEVYFLALSNYRDQCKNLL